MLEIKQLHTTIHCSLLNSCCLHQEECCQRLVYYKFITAISVHHYSTWQRDSFLHVLCSFIEIFAKSSNIDPSLK